MSSPSNLYAEKVFSEHPLSLWPLDDKADYISLINESQRDVSDWTISGGTAESITNIFDEPFPNSSVTKLVGNIISELSGSIVCVSDNLINFTSLNQDMATFSIGGYFYAKSPYLFGVEIGYEYYDTVQGENVQVLKQFSTSVTEKWTFVSETFDIPTDNTTMRLVFKINYLGGSSDPADYEFFVNGISFGQWSEEFNSTSLGITKITLPQDIFGETKYGIVAKAYGLQESDGYYLINNNSLMARNSGVPMVYGSSNVTFISPNENQPSLVIPGHGFMNSVGQYKDYTVEMWLRITADTSTPKRIFGPIRSSDGLYVDGPFIRLKIWDKIGSHYIGEWSRPMLIHIKMVENKASLMINGDQVISLDYVTSELVLPDEYSLGLHNDWLAFYSYEDVFPIELDAFAIYTYQVPPVVAKRRFIYGQGVEFPENINTAYSGTSIYVDYPFADYTNDYSYPDIGNWRQGILENVAISNNTLTMPNYTLPDLVLESTETQTFLDQNLLAQLEDDNLVSFNPTNGQQMNGYMLFPNLNILTEDTKAFYGIFKSKSFAQSEVLFFIENEITGNKFEVVVDDESIKYNLISGTTSELIYEAFGAEVGEIYSVGIHIENFSNYYGPKVAEFFGNRSQLKLYLGGYKDFDRTFTGNIYKVGFCNEKNYSEVGYLFNSAGVTLDYENVFNLYNQTQSIDFDAGDQYFGNNGSYYLNDGTFIPNLGYYWDYFINSGDPLSFVSTKLSAHTASYTLVPKIYYGSFTLDIDVVGSWKDYLPLTYFAQYVTDSKGRQYYDLDFIQFNIDYPAPSKFIEEAAESSEGWTYAELQYEYSNPIQRSYSSLDNHLFTGYTDYEDLKNRSVKTYSYDTSSSLVKTSVTFQYTETGANASDNYFINYIPAPKSGIVDPGESWMTTEYEVVDNMLIYPPAGANFEDIAVVVNVDFKIPGIINNSVKIRKLQMSSQAFNKDSANPIGTRFGTPIYPYIKSGLYFDYKSKNPFTIYKSSSPYLYMTRYSGIQLKGGYDPLVNRGLSMPINQTKADNYKVLAMQVALRYDEDFFPYAPTQIFEIQSKNTTIKFYMVATHPDGKRAKIYAVNANTGRIENGIAFYLNGLIVKDPTINIKQWAFLGISFSSLLDFSRYSGAFRINGPVLVNTISHYQSTNLQEVQKVSTRPWFKVKFAPPLTLDWEYWDSAYMWQGVLVLSSTSYYGVDPSDVYKTYTGTNKIIVDDPRVFSLNNYEYSVIKEVSWQGQTIEAV